MEETSFVVSGLFLFLNLIAPSIYVEGDTFIVPSDGDRYSVTGPEMKKTNQAPIMKVNETENNTFYVECNSSRKYDTLEIYKIIGNVSTLVHSSNSSIATATITTCDNYTNVYCRGVTGENRETFYSSNHTTLFIYNPVKSSVCQNATASDQCVTNVCCLKQSDNESSDTELIKLLTIVVPSTLIGILLITTITFFTWKRYRMRVDRRKELKVLYADIQLSEQSNVEMPKREETPYAEIVGVLYPANNDKPRRKPKQVPVEESPYAVPYVNHYNLAIK